MLTSEIVEYKTDDTVYLKVDNFNIWTNTADELTEINFSFSDAITSGGEYWLYAI